MHSRRRILVVARSALFPNRRPARTRPSPRACPRTAETVAPFTAVIVPSVAALELAEEPHPGISRHPPLAPIGHEIIQASIPLQTETLTWSTGSTDPDRPAIGRLS